MGFGDCRLSVTTTATISATIVYYFYYFIHYTIAFCDLLSRCINTTLCSQFFPHTLIHIQRQQLFWLFSVLRQCANRFFTHAALNTINRKTRTNNATTKCNNNNNNCCIYLAFFINFCCKITKNSPPRSLFYEINERTNDYKFGRLNAIPYSVDTLQFYCNLTMKAFYFIVNVFNFNFSVNFRIIRTAARVPTLSISKFMVNLWAWANRFETGECPIDFRFYSCC